MVKDAQIREELEKILGASRALQDKYVFVEQGKLVELFQQTDTQRHETLSHLTGTKVIGKKCEVVNKRRELDLQLLNIGVADVDRLRQELGDYEERLRKETANSAKIAADLHRRLRESDSRQFAESDATTMPQRRSYRKRPRA
jgi:DNA repair exonuclease SbcCD ATPase subunit